jgi:heat-inducible transcriptional repressor
MPADRGQTILQLVVEAYIRDAQPISSSAVLRLHPNLGLSPATVRATMADLEATGLLTQPHSSSGRIPTEAGMRVYLDHLVGRRLHPWDRQRLERAVTDSAESLSATEFAGQLSATLAALTGQMVLVAQPRFLGGRLREVGLVRYDAGRVLAYFVSPNGLVQQKLLQLEEDLSAQDLQNIQNYLNDRLRDRTLGEVRLVIDAELADNAAHPDRRVAQALKIGESLLPQAHDGPMDVFVEGTSHLLEQPEFSDLRKMRGLLRAIEEKRTLLSLVARVLDHSGVKVMLGSEHHVADVQDLTCVGCAYRGAAGGGAAVTIMGPSRMDYSRLVPLVQHAARIYGRFWEQL